MTSPRLALPRFEEPERPGGIPIVASLVPLAVALAAWALTRSPYALIFAVASPLAAAGAMLDRRFRRRRERRRMLERTRVRLARLRDAVDAAHGEERARREASVPDPARYADGVVAPGAGMLRWGRARQPSGIVIDAGDDDPPVELAAEVAALVQHAATLRAPVLSAPPGEIVVAGPPVLARAAARGLAVQLLAAHPDVVPSASWSGDPGAGTSTADADALVLRGPRGAVCRIRFVPEGAPAPPGSDAVLRLGGSGSASLELQGRDEPLEGFEVALLGETTARAAAEALQAQSGAGADAPPSVVGFDELAALPPREGGLAAPVGRAADGPVWVDLVRDGPHAVVGGTTGSGKSELLVSWVLGIADRYGPDRVAFLLVDFKGASAFSSLRHLPHVVGIVSDLDTGVSRRATQSLRSELRRREAVLAEAGAKDVAELPEVPRLVVVVDEYAALVAEHPELHELIGDLAARGRSLGIHLILCSQRPGGVMRDAVLANAVLRVCLRVNNRADSMAMIGSDAAAAIAPDPAGRGLVTIGGTDPVAVQFAQAVEADIARVADRHRASAPPARPWAEPLPERVRLAELSPAADGAVFALADLPEEQRLAGAAYDPGRDGTLLVVGGRGAGTTTALAALGAGLGDRVVVVPSELPDAWATLRSVLDAERPEGTVLIVDDVDRMIDGADEEFRPGLVRLLASLARELAVRDGALVLGASRMPSTASALTSRIDCRLILQLPDREQHVLAGGTGADWVARRPPGRGLWREHEVQVAVGGALPEPVRLPPRVVDLTPGRPLAVASGQSDRLGERLRSEGVTVVRVGEAVPTGSGGRVTVVLGDPDEWTDAWSVLESARRDLPFLVHGVPASELRTLGRLRGDPPPLDPRGREAWLLSGRRADRVRVPWALPLPPVTMA